MQRLSKQPTSVVLQPKQILLPHYLREGDGEHMVCLAWSNVGTHVVVGSGSVISSWRSDGILCGRLSMPSNTNGWNVVCIGETQILLQCSIDCGSFESSVTKWLAPMHLQQMERLGRPRRVGDIGVCVSVAPNQEWVALETVPLRQSNVSGWPVWWTLYSIINRRPMFQMSISNRSMLHSWEPQSRWCALASKEASTVFLVAPLHDGGREEEVQCGHLVEDMAVSLDGQRLAVVCERGHCWAYRVSMDGTGAFDVALDRPMRSLRVRMMESVFLRWTPDDRLICVLEREPSIVLTDVWGGSRPRVVAKVRGPAEMRLLSVSPDAQRMLVVGRISKSLFGQNVVERLPVVLDFGAPHFDLAPRENWADASFG
ncbi:hypothetical protein HYV74_03520 [Candidatus Uhrbacteria bacterium]|nr:hypothetical protein [Candidatus Uhrbacteria bacterium]